MPKTDPVLDALAGLKAFRSAGLPVATEDLAREDYCLMRALAHVEVRTAPTASGYVVHTGRDPHAVYLTVDPDLHPKLLAYLISRACFRRFCRTRTGAAVAALATVWSGPYEAVEGSATVREETECLWRVRDDVGRLRRLRRMRKRALAALDCDVVDVGARLLSPTDAAYRTGRALRDAGDLALASQWTRLSLWTARAERDVESEARALNALGNLLRLRGSFPRSAAMLHRARRMARRHALRERTAAVHHDFAALGLDNGDRELFIRNAATACRMYGPNHPRSLHLTNDMGAFWNEHGEFARALAVLRPLPRLFSDPAYRALAWANLARAAAGCGQEGEFLSACANARLTLGACEKGWSEPSVRLLLGQAALSARRFDVALEELQQAITAARASGQHEVLFSAESWADAVLSERGAVQWLGVPSRPEEDAVAEEIAGWLQAA